MTTQLKLKNLDMDEGLKSTFRAKIEQLLDVSPSDAGATSKITKTKSGYLGVLLVVSSQG